MLGAIPPFEELFKMAGMELPSYLKGKTIEEGKSEVIAEEHKPQEPKE